MKRKPPAKLELNRETLRTPKEPDLSDVLGGTCSRCRTNETYCSNGADCSHPCPI